MPLARPVPYDAVLRATGKAVVQSCLAPYQAWKTIRPVKYNRLTSRYSLRLEWQDKTKFHLFHGLGEHAAPGAQPWHEPRRAFARPLLGGMW